MSSLNFIGLATRLMAEADFRSGFSKGNKSKKTDTAFHKALGKILSELEDQITPESCEDMWRLGTTNLKIMISLSHDSKVSMGDGIEAILYAMVTNAYAAFETLSQDLWREAVNANSKLANEFMKNNKDKSFSFDKLSQYGLNLQAVIGSMLINENKARFQSLSDLKKSYSDAFGDEVHSVFDENPTIEAASKVRHLIAHRGGLIDDKFKMELAEFDQLKNLCVGQYLELDGPTVCALTDTLVKTSVALVKFVDRWLKANAP